MFVRLLWNEKVQKHVDLTPFTLRCHRADTSMESEFAGNVAVARKVGQGGIKGVLPV